MVIKTKELKELCSKVLAAVDNSSLQEITDMLQLRTDNNSLVLSVTNGEYFVSVFFALEESMPFNATVNANLFLKLISQTTSENVELLISQNSLTINGNGEYRIPLIYDNSDILELPEISITNKTVCFNIATEILKSIYNYNSKEIVKSGFERVRPVQKLYYMDDHGCITFTSGACVNNFSLQQPIKLLLNDRIVKLFKLFSCDNVRFSLGSDTLSSGIVQTKASFVGGNVSITAILPMSDSLIAQVPVASIRQRASNLYQYQCVINKNDLQAALNRIMLFNLGKSTNKLEFSPSGFSILGHSSGIKESLSYVGDSPINTTYEMFLNVNELKITLDSIDTSHVNFSFGDHQAVVLARGNVYNIIPEVDE